MSRPRAQQPGPHLLPAFLRDHPLQPPYSGPINKLGKALYDHEDSAMRTVALWHALGPTGCRAHIHASELLRMKSDKSNGLHYALDKHFALGRCLAGVRMPDAKEGPALYVPPHMARSTIIQLVLYYVTTPPDKRCQPPVGWPLKPMKRMRKVRNRFVQVSPVVAAVLASFASCSCSYLCYSLARFLQLWLARVAALYASPMTVYMKKSVGSSIQYCATLSFVCCAFFMREHA